jgi:hypothetical protein
MSRPPRGTANFTTKTPGFRRTAGNFLSVPDKSGRALVVRKTPDMLVCACERARHPGGGVLHFIIYEMRGKPRRSRLSGRTAPIQKLTARVARGEPRRTRRNGGGNREIKQGARLCAPFAYHSHLRVSASIRGLCSPAHQFAPIYRGRATFSFLLSPFSAKRPPLPQAPRTRT